MSDAGGPIVVAGDATIDWFFYPVAGTDSPENWRRHDSHHFDALGGGALFLTELIRGAVAGRYVEVVGPTLPPNIRAVEPSAIVHSNARLGPVSDASARKGGASRERLLRVREVYGYSGPLGRRVKPVLPARPSRPPACIVIDDAGNGFRDRPKAWRALLADAGEAILVHKLSHPLNETALWRALERAGSARHVVVVNVKDLRRTAGFKISHAISWERTAKEFVYHILLEDQLRWLQECAHLIVLFGTDGAIIYRGGEENRARLVFDPESVEDRFAETVDGQMIGLTSVFTATLAAWLHRKGIGEIERGVREGLGRTRRFYRAGLRLSADRLRYPLAEVFAGRAGSEFESCGVEPPTSLELPDPGHWRILDDETRENRFDLAREILVTGTDKALRGIPIGAFGKNFRTIDRAEIESYGAIRELIGEFMSDPTPSRPLCLAVFGPPGSGKSFGVKQLAESVLGSTAELATFNVSQFQTYADLVAALHTVRDVSLRGKIPFVFFDEFDSPVEGEPLGWLKSFLAPMQDAEFREGEAVHPLGRAILVFAGGTSFSYREFVEQVTESRGRANAEAAKKREEYRAAKAPDFVSRLHGYIDIMGPNRQGDADEASILRRAMILRSLIERSEKAARLFGREDGLTLDDGILRALLHVEEYRHGNRSMASLIAMSRIAGKSRFDRSSLPQRDQIELHVDAEEFLWLVEKERFFTITSPREIGEGDSVKDREAGFVEKVARAVHEDYLQHRREEKADQESVEPWDRLSVGYRQSNRAAAEDIPRKLAAIRVAMRRVREGDPTVLEWTEREIETLARMEHERWMGERRLQGWRYGRVRNEEEKRTPHLVPFGRLKRKVQDYDRQAVRAIPRILAGVGYELYRQQSLRRAGTDPARETES